MAIALCLINQKGGCGKSSTSFHLAGAWASAGLRVLLLDLEVVNNQHHHVPCHHESADLIAINSSVSLRLAKTDELFRSAGVLARTGLGVLQVCLTLSLYRREGTGWCFRVN